MSDWNVYLVYSDAKSNKFWRAKAEGSDLTINYGRIGTNGQTQVKSFDSSEKCIKEMDKTANSKRKKGYQDEGSAIAATADEQASTPAVDTGPQKLDLELELDKRKVDLQLSVTGNAIRTVVVENYNSAETAAAAFDRLKEAMEAEGYKTVGARKDL